jgi:hypothetical protein
LEEWRLVKAGLEGAVVVLLLVLPWEDVGRESDCVVVVFAVVVVDDMVGVLCRLKIESVVFDDVDVVRRDSVA